MRNERPLQIIPVLDLLHGQVVRGVAGERDSYRPIVSRLSTTAQPRDVAAGLRTAFDLSMLYVADLDAILHRRVNLDTLRELVEDGWELLVDAGLRTAEEAVPLFSAGVSAVVAGLETIAGPQEPAALVQKWGAERVVFSLDLKQGRPLASCPAWQQSDPETIMANAVAAGITRLIVLDLAAVGMGSGISTLPLCRSLLQAHPHLELITGGGVRSVADLRDAEQAGVHGVLVASALHDGRISRGDLKPQDGF